MDSPITRLTFDDWIRYVFDHPVTSPQWYWAYGEGEFMPEPAECVEYLAELFRNPDVILAPHSDAQLEQGFWYLVDNSCSNYMFTLLEPPVPWAERRQGIRSIAMLFERLFARRCTDRISHLDRGESRPLNLVCYM